MVLAKRVAQHSRCPQQASSRADAGTHNAQRLPGCPGRDFPQHCLPCLFGVAARQAGRAAQQNQADQQHGHFQPVQALGQAPAAHSGLHRGSISAPWFSLGLPSAPGPSLHVPCQPRETRGAGGEMQGTRVGIVSFGLRKGSWEHVRAGRRNRVAKAGEIGRELSDEPT